MYSTHINNKFRMLTTQQVLINKLSAVGSIPSKVVKAAERRDYAAVCFMLLKELADAEDDIEKHEAADKHNRALYEKTCEKLKAAKEENVILKKKIKEQQFEKDVAQRGSQQMLEWYEEDDQKLRDDIDRLTSANIQLQHELIEANEAKEDLRQRIGYKSIVIEEHRRTIISLEEEKDAQALYISNLQIDVADNKEKISELEYSQQCWEKAYKELKQELAKANERVAALSVFNC